MVQSYIWKVTMFTCNFFFFSHSFRTFSVTTPTLTWPVFTLNWTNIVNSNQSSRRETNLILERAGERNNCEANWQPHYWWVCADRRPEEPGPWRGEEFAVIRYQPYCIGIEVIFEVGRWSIRYVKQTDRKD